jgi:hypothetical protein
VKSAVKIKKMTIFEILRNKLLYHFEGNELSKIRKSREFPRPNAFSSREGILQDSHVQSRPSSKPQHQILLWRSTSRRKLTTRNLESLKDDGSHEDESWGKIGLRIENEFGTW